MSPPEHGRAGAQGERDAARNADLTERKERVLHTRVPDSLDRHIKRRARSSGMSVSTIVRNVLLNTFGLVEDIVTDSANIALSIAGEQATPRGARSRARAAATADGVPEVVAWQEATLNLNAVCERCNAVLRKGTKAAVGVRERSGPPAIICKRCLGRLARRGG